METDIAKVERIGRTRAAVFYLMSAAFLLSAVLGLQATDSPAQLIGWLCLASLVALNLTAAPLRPGRLKHLLNDETTRNHRQHSFVIGFWTSIATAMALAITQRAVPIEAGDLARLVVTVSLSAALICFATLELRASR